MSQTIKHKVKFALIFNFFFLVNKFALIFIMSLRLVFWNFWANRDLCLSQFDFRYTQGRLDHIKGVISHFDFKQLYITTRVGAKYTMYDHATRREGGNSVDFMEIFPDSFVLILCMLLGCTLVLERNSNRMQVAVARSGSTTFLWYNDQDMIFAYTFPWLGPDPEKLQ